MERKMDDIFFAVNNRIMPQVSAMDTCTHKPPYVHFKRHYHEYILYLITEGELFLREDGEEYHLKKNDCILLDPSRTHMGIKASSFSFCYFHFLPGYGENKYKEVNEDYVLGNDEVLLPKYHQLENEENIEFCRELCGKVHALSMVTDSISRLKASSLLHLIMLIIADDIEKSQFREISSGKKNNSVVNDLKWYIQQHYMEKFESEEISLNFGYNYDHLNRIFKADTGETIYQFLLKIRCKEAGKLIDTGYYSNTEIASRVGFGSSEHFCNAYKKYMGYSPRQKGK